ncbi:hypothetical protein [Bacteroides cellulosilyticus]|uniref:hypothetical protein n=1 Tax=Bacteroides cellulosilyticus TaxID=246787 RepID=UPI001F3333E9|nr:hypothetical protein [Bacteroides cellulosilyticus]
MPRQTFPASEVVTWRSLGYATLSAMAYVVIRVTVEVVCSDYGCGVDYNASK